MAWWFAMGVAGMAVLVSLFAALLAETACNWDTSYCASADETTEHRGRVFTPEGRPLATRVAFHLESLRGRSREFATDPQGRYCVVLPSESVTEHVVPAPGVSAAPADPRFATPEGRAALAQHASLPGEQRAMPIVVMEPRTTAPESTRPLWRPETDRAAACERPGRLAAWHRYDDLHSTWQAWLLRLIPLAGLLGLAVVAASRLRHSPRATLAPLAGFAVAALEALALFALY